MRSKYCPKCDDWHDAAKPWPHKPTHGNNRSDLATPYFVSDNLGQHLMNHADGKRYDSRSAYYKAVKQAGGEIIGNEPPKPFVPKKIKGSGADIKQAIEQLRSR